MAQAEKGYAQSATTLLIYLDATAALRYLVNSSGVRILFPLCLFSASVLPLLLAMCLLRGSSLDGGGAGRLKAARRGSSL